MLPVRRPPLIVSLRLLLPLVFYKQLHRGSAEVQLSAWRRSRRSKARGGHGEGVHDDAGNARLANNSKRLERR